MKNKFNNTLDNPEQQVLLDRSFNSLDQADQDFISTLDTPLNITALVDGRSLACPMPLLKTKVALRSMKGGESVYVLATDPNSQTDLNAFCQQSGLKLILNTGSNMASSDSLKKLDTIFHLIITKTDGN